MRKISKSRIDVYAPEETKNQLKKYCAKVGKSESEVSLEFILEGLKMKSYKEDIDFFTTQIEKCLDPKFEKFENRICKLMAITSKYSISDMLLLVNLISKLELGEEDSNYIKEKLEKVNKQSAYILKEKDFLNVNLNNYIKSGE